MSAELLELEELDVLSAAQKSEECSSETRSTNIGLFILASEGRKDLVVVLLAGCPCLWAEKAIPFSVELLQVGGER